MKIARVVLVCTCCKHRIVDPAVILAVRRMKETGLVARYGCVRCHALDGTDVEIEETIEEMIVDEPLGDVDVSDCIAPDATTEARLRRLEAALEALRELVHQTLDGLKAERDIARAALAEKKS